ncbi:TonB-dependent receptor [Burkholderiaceae bacterium UC74_6]
MKTKSRQGRSRRLALALVALPWCALAHAQTADADKTQKTEKADKAEKAEQATLDTVVITAERRSAPLQKSSLSATVLSGDDLLKSGVGIIDQLQFVTPSTAANNYGQGLNITIRGIGKAETNTQTKTGVITYRDGVATSPGYFTSEPYYDIASVQILRGPQGTFGGQNATGGAVIVDSNDPIINGGTTGYLLGQFGNYSDIGVQGAVNLPISSTLAARIAFNTEKRDSFWKISGPYTGGDGALNAKSVRLGLLWKPSPQLSVLFKSDLNNINMGGYPAGPVALTTSDPFSVSSNAYQMARDRFGRSVLKVEYTFDNGMKFRSVTGRQGGNTAYSGDLDGTATASSVFYDSTDEKLYSQEFNLISPDAGPLTWVLGAYANKDEFIVLPGNLYSGVTSSPLTVYSFYGNTPSRTRAFFGQVAYQLTEDLKLVVDSRYSKTHHSLNLDIQQYGLPLSQRQSVNFEGLSGKVALNWTLNKDHFLYAFVASANRPGGLNVPVGLGPASAFDAEKVTSSEVGWKASWLGGHLTTQTSVFYNDYKNFQVTIGYPAIPVFGVEVNTPNATKIYGVEQQLQAQLGDGWSLRANVGWMSSSLGAFFATDPRVPAVAACDPVKGPGSASCINLSGHQQTYAPELTYNFGLERRFTVGDTVITPRINYAHVSAQWATLFENRTLGDRLGSRNLTSAQIDFERGDYTASVYSTNLSDSRYTSAITAGLRYPGAPRQYGVRITKFF